MREAPTIICSRDCPCDVAEVDVINDAPSNEQATFNSCDRGCGITSMGSCRYCHITFCEQCQRQGYQYLVDCMCAVRCYDDITLQDGKNPACHNQSVAPCATSADEGRTPEPPIQDGDGSVRRPPPQEGVVVHDVLTSNDALIHRNGFIHYGEHAAAAGARGLSAPPAIMLAQTVEEDPSTKEIEDSSFNGNTDPDHADENKADSIEQCADSTQTNWCRTCGEGFGGNPIPVRRIICCTGCNPPHGHWFHVDCAEMAHVCVHCPVPEETYKGRVVMLGNRIANDDSDNVNVGVAGPKTDGPCSLNQDNVILNRSVDSSETTGERYGPSPGAPKCVVCWTDESLSFGVDTRGQRTSSSAPHRNINQDETDDDGMRYGKRLDSPRGPDGRKEGFVLKCAGNVKSAGDIQCRSVLPSVVVDLSVSKDEGVNTYIAAKGNSDRYIVAKGLGNGQTHAFEIRGSNRYTRNP